MERKLWASPRSPEAALALAQAAADIISPRDGVSMSPFKRSSAKRESNTSRLKEYADARQHQALLLEMGRTPEEALKELRYRERVILADAGDEEAQIMVSLDKREHLKVSEALGHVAMLKLGDATSPSGPKLNATRLLLNRPSSPHWQKILPETTINRKKNQESSSSSSLLLPEQKLPPPPPPPPPPSKGTPSRGGGSLLSPRAATVAIPTTTPKSASKPSTAVNSRRGSTTPTTKAISKQGTITHDSTTSSVSGVVAHTSRTETISDSVQIERTGLEHEVAELELLAALGQKALVGATD
jgi:hypothetical protein